MKNYDMHVDLWSLPNNTPANFVVLYRTTPKRREEPKEEGGWRREEGGGGFISFDTEHRCQVQYHHD